MDEVLKVDTSVDKGILKSVSPTKHQKRKVKKFLSKKAKEMFVDAKEAYKSKLKEAEKIEAEEELKSLEDEYKELVKIRNTVQKAMLDADINKKFRIDTIMRLKDEMPKSWTKRRKEIVSGKTKPKTNK